MRADNHIFQFKRFKIDQTGCAMKVNTDGLLLATLAQIENPNRVLDVGTGTGLIALIMAQRFDSSIIDAVEIDSIAAQRAQSNFKDSPFYERLNLINLPITDYFSQSDISYDLIISNPPFFINSLKNENQLKEQARHTTEYFFKDLLVNSAQKLNEGGSLILILPIETADLIEKMIKLIPNLNINEVIMIHSFEMSIAHRKILKIGLNYLEMKHNKFVIYESHGIYSDEYQKLLKDYLTIF